MYAYFVRRTVNNVGVSLAVLCLLCAVIPLGAMLYYVLAQGGSSLTVAFFTQVPVAFGLAGGGFANAILGTLYLIPLSSAIGLPIGILSGIYLAQAGNGRFAQTSRFVTDVIAGTPSVVAGVVAYALIVIPFHLYSLLTGSVALGLLMFPTVTRATEESIKLVPASVREAALALGLPEWKTMVRIVLPAAINGIITAIMLGIARVAGETAPLYFTIFGNPNVPTSPLDKGDALPLQIWKFSQSVDPANVLHRQSWGAAFVLFAFIVILNLTARLLTYRLSRRVSLS
jgi:phosphate transport system permease protein